MSAVKTILIRGFSGRAAAWSVIRAGWLPRVEDECQDQDLPPRQNDPQSTQSQEILWLPTGGWENRPEQWQELENRFEVLGCSVRSLQVLRDPVRLQQILGKSGFRTPGLQKNAAQATASHRWLRKPLHSTGGLGVKLVDGSTLPDSSSHFDQEFLAGSIYSAQFYSANDHASLFGVCQGIAGCPEVPEQPFLYAGSLGPILPGMTTEITGSVWQTLQQLGNELTRQCGMKGVWGCDFICNPEVTVLEVNPRYTSAMEVIELALQHSILNPSTDPSQLLPSPSCPLLGKRIVYAPCDLQIPLEWKWKSPWIQPDDLLSASWVIPEFSDCPHPGTLIQCGDPICTVWQSGEKIVELSAALEQKARCLLQQLKP